MPAPAYPSVEQYAAHVLMESVRVIEALQAEVGAQHPAVLTLNHFITEAATLLQQERMQRERSAADAYNLATLPAPVYGVSPASLWRNEE